MLFRSNDSGARSAETLPMYVEAAVGELPSIVQVVERGATFEAPLAEGQKTGWFYDQAANRRQFLPLIKGSKRVLDVFSYVGAWAVPAGLDGAEVTCVDASQTALDAAQANGAARPRCRRDKRRWSGAAACGPAPAQAEATI